MKTQYPKNLWKGVAVLAVVLSLNGCATVKEWLAPSIASQQEASDVAHNQQLIRECDQAPVLYTNLAAPRAERLYSLPGSQEVCPWTEIFTWN